MTLKARFFYILVLAPTLALVFFLYAVSSTFVTYKTSDVFENQQQLLNSAHMVFSRTDSRELPQRVKQVIDQDGYEDLLITDVSGKIRYAASDKLIGKSAADALGPILLDKLRGQATESGSFETVNAGKNKILVSFLGIDIDSNRFFLLLSKSKTAVNRPTMLFLYKAGAMLLALFAFSVVMSLLVAEQITSGIEQVSTAVGKFSLERKDVSLPVAKFQLNEIVQFNKSFADMRERIRLHIHDYQNEAREDAKHKISSEIRRIFLPTPIYKTPWSELAASFDPGKSGGDFWHHFPSSTHLLFMMASTGHGIDQATLASICRSALSMVRENYKGPRLCLRMLNSVIYETIGAKVKMSACFCSLDMLSGQLYWATAGSRGPLIVSGTTTGTGADVDLQIDDKWPPLGVDIESDYTEHEVQLKDGDLIVLLSPGAQKLQTPEQPSVAMQALHEIKNPKDVDPENVIKHLQESAAKVQPPGERPEDISFMVAKWRSP